MWLRFQIISFPYAGGENQAEATIISNSASPNVKLLTPAAMVDNLAEKVNKCPLNWGH